MSARIIRKHTVNYNDSDGEAQTFDYASRFNGNVSVKPGGSVFLCMLTLVLSIPTEFGELIEVLEKLVARVTVDGSVVIEPTERLDDYMVTLPGTSEEVSRPGRFVYNLVNREVLVEMCKKSLPGFSKRVKLGLAAHAKKAQSIAS